MPLRQLCALDVYSVSNFIIKKYVIALNVPGKNAGVPLRMENAACNSALIPFAAHSCANLPDRIVFRLQWGQQP